MRLFLSLILLSFYLNIQAQRQHLIFESGFEDTTLSEWSQIERCYIDRVSTSSVIRKAGVRSGRFYSKGVDSLGCTVVRSQVVFNDTNSTNFDRWYGFSAYTGPSYPINYDGVEFFLEFLRSDTIDEYTPLGLSYQGFEQTANVNWPAGSYINTYMVRRTDPPASPYTIFINPLRPIVNNQWFDIVMHIKWSNDTTGRIRIWVNDYLSYSYNGVTNYSPNKLRIGIDKWDWRKNWHISTTTEREIYIDEFRIGDSLATYNDVKPGYTTPLPILWYIFNATKDGNNVKLYWEAEFGNNFNKFIVERNTGSSWVPIGEVYNNVLKEFNFTDYDPQIINQYRIKALNFGELDKYSDVRVIRFSRNNSPIKIYVYNTIGQLVKVYTSFNGQNINDIKRNLNIITGIYIFKYENGQVEKVFIEK